jgi:phosphomannomutase/phosphoglucomutase
MIPLFLEPDGNFPNHHPNPMHEKNREDARKTLLQNHSDIAFIFDGDADRVMILDDMGEVLTSGIISSVIVSAIAKKYPNAGYIGNATVSHIFADTVNSVCGYYEREMV